MTSNIYLVEQYTLKCDKVKEMVEKIEQNKRVREDKVRVKRLSQLQGLPN